MNILCSKLNKSWFSLLFDIRRSGIPGEIQKQQEQIWRRKLRWICDETTKSRGDQENQVSDSVLKTLYNIGHD